MRHYHAMDNTTTTDRRGAALVEMALVLPVFLTILLGIIEFGRAVTVSQMMVSSAREGARLAILSGNDNSDVEQRVRQFASKTLDVAPGKVSVEITIVPAPGNPSTGNVANSNTGDVVTIKASIPIDEVTYIPGTHFKGKTLSGQVSMRRE